MIRHFGAVWAQPDLCGCSSVTLDVVVDVGTGATFGVAEGVETWSEGFGVGGIGATGCGAC